MLDILAIALALAALAVAIGAIVFADKNKKKIKQTEGSLGDVQSYVKEAKEAKEIGWHDSTKVYPIGKTGDKNVLRAFTLSETQLMSQIGTKSVEAAIGALLFRAKCTDECWGISIYQMKGSIQTILLKAPFGLKSTKDATGDSQPSWAGTYFLIPSNASKQACSQMMS